MLLAVCTSDFGKLVSVLQLEHFEDLYYHYYYYYHIYFYIYYY